MHPLLIHDSSLIVNLIDRNMDEYKRLPLRLLRCPSAISTADGGLTPLTEIGSPQVRSPNELSGSGSIEEEIIVRTQTAQTNLTQLSITSGYRVDEYLVSGSMDLVVCVFAALETHLGTNRLVMLPVHDDMSHTTLLAVSESCVRPISVPSTIDGVSLKFVVSHTNRCSCRKCVGLHSYILRKSGARVGKFDFIDSSALSSLPQHPLVALPGFKAKTLPEGFPGGLTIATDLIVKWFGAGASVLELMQTLAARGKSRGDMEKILSHCWVYSSYNGRIHRVKKIWFDLTPLSSSFFNTKTGKVVTYANYVEDRYGCRVEFPTSPLVEVYSEKRNEKVYLIPEFCVLVRANGSGPSGQYLTGALTRPIPMHTVHIQTRLPPIDRESCLQAAVAGMEISDKFKPCISIADIDVEGHIIGGVTGGEGRTSPAMLSLRRPARWGIVFMGVDPSVLKSTLSVTIDVLGDPTVVVECNDAVDAAVDSTLRIHPFLELIAVVVKGKQAMAQYGRLKYMCCVTFGIACQIVRAETLVKRDPEIVSDLNRQIITKLGRCRLPTSRGPVIGLDFHRFGDISIFSVSVLAKGRITTKYRIESGATMTDDAMAGVYFELLLWYVVGRQVGPGASPVIYLASRRGVVHSERLVERIGLVFSKYTFLVMCVKTDLRLFSESGNVEPGFALDTDRGFYLVPHRVGQGNALPVYYLVVERGDLSTDELKSVTKELCVDNHRLPQLFTHTLRLSELIGIHLRRCAGKDLARTLEGSPGWTRLMSSDQPFYL